MHLYVWERGDKEGREGGGGLRGTGEEEKESKGWREGRER